MCEWEEGSKLIDHSYIILSMAVPLYPRGHVAGSPADARSCGWYESYINYVFFLYMHAFSLKEALHGFSLACPNCQHHEPPLRFGAVIKAGWLGHKHRDIRTVDLMTQVATSDSQAGGMQWGCAGQREDSCPRWEGAAQLKFHPALQNSVRFKTYELFIPEVCPLVVLGCGWLRVTEAVESESTEKGARLCANTWLG